MKKRSLLVVCSLLSLVSLASCGANSFDNEKLIIGLECAYQPFNWSETSSSDYNLAVSNKRNYYADGYDIQIAKLLGKELNKEVEMVQTKWESMIPDLQMGSINCIIGGMTDTPERRQSIAFSDEYYRSELVLITSKASSELYSEPLSENEIKDVLNDKVIVSQKGTVTNDVIDIFVDKYGAIKNPALLTFGDCANDVNNGSVFAMTAELPVANSLCKSFLNLGIVRIDQSILGQKQAELGVSIGVNKLNTSLKDELNSALKKIDAATRLNLMNEAVERSSK